jgi:hypothetical protein
VNCLPLLLIFFEVANNHYISIYVFILGLPVLNHQVESPVDESNVALDDPSAVDSTGSTAIIIQLIIIKVVEP